MSGDKAMPIFGLGLVLLTASVMLADKFFETVSWWPTLLYIPALIFLLVGQLWFIGAFAEEPEASPAAFFMFALICLLPPLITLRYAWGTEYDFMKWTAAALLAAPPMLLLLVIILSLWPERWKRRSDEEVMEMHRKTKRKLPG